MLISYDERNLESRSDETNHKRSVFCTRIPSDMYNGRDLRIHFSRYATYSWKKIGHEKYIVNTSNNKYIQYYSKVTVNHLALC